MNDRESEIVDISDESLWEHSKQTLDRVASEQQEQALDNLPDDTELTIQSVLMLKKPKHRYRISFGNYAMEVHEDVMIKYRMIKGAVFTKSELEDIVSADERQRAYADAIAYLSRKPRTAYEISFRLREKGWGEETIQEVVERLGREGFVDDAAYAQEWASQRVKNRGKGKLWVRHELRQKGVSKPLIEEALDEVSEDEEISSAMQLARKKWQGTSGEPADKMRKTGAFLLRRGYSGAVVSKVVRELSRRDGFSVTEDWEEE